MTSRGSFKITEGIITVSALYSVASMVLGRRNMNKVIMAVMTMDEISAFL
jgi:hypothetical protein